jgi:hypothetical protein
MTKDSQAAKGSMQEERSLEDKEKASLITTGKLQN